LNGQTSKIKTPLKFNAQPLNGYFKKLLFLTLCFLPSLKINAQTKTNFDKNTWVFMVGVLEWAVKNEFASSMSRLDKSFDKRNK
jgi:hypothetical protein